MGGLGCACLALGPSRVFAGHLQDDFTIISQLPDLPGRDGPLLVFRDFETDSDIEVEYHIRTQLKQRKDLSDLLKEKISPKKRIKVSIEQMKVCLKFVPEKVNGAGGAYKRYSLSVLDFLFDSIPTDNFYESVTIPTTSFPKISPSGISVFLVHRMAKDYRAVLKFSPDSGRSLKYNSSGAIFSRHLGAVDLKIKNLGNGRFILKRRPYTIWQNECKSFSNLIAIPVEETLHYHVGTATDRQIAAMLRQSPPATSTMTQQLANEWIAVEEAIVGGLVWDVLNRYCTRYELPPPGEEKISTAQSHAQYKYRKQGIRLVQKLGFQDSLKLYMDSPPSFRNLLG